MKLAEALSIRKDLQMRIEQLRERLTNNVRVQEGEMPYEQPEELMKELDSCLNQWQKWIYSINVTNMRTIYNGKTLTQLQADGKCSKNESAFSEVRSTLHHSQ